MIVREGGQTAGISNCTGLNKRRRYAFKINNCTGLTLREEKSVTRIKSAEFTHKKSISAELISANG